MNYRNFVIRLQRYWVLGSLCKECDLAKRDTFLMEASWRERVLAVRDTGNWGDMQRELLQVLLTSHNPNDARYKDLKRRLLEDFSVMTKQAYDDGCFDSCLYLWAEVYALLYENAESNRDSLLAFIEMNITNLEVLKKLQKMFAAGKSYASEMKINEKIERLRRAHP